MLKTMIQNLLTTKNSAERRSERWIFGVMLFFGIAGLAASFTLSVEEFHLIKNPDAILSCSINLILNCATVMKTWQASVFGFPNMFIGLVAFPVVITIAIAGLSGVKFPRAFMKTAQVFYALGLVFAYWLFFQSVYVIQVLCPWCLIVTVSTTLIFESLLRYNLLENNLGLLNKHHKMVLGWLNKDYDKLLVAGWLVLLVLLVVLKFGDGLFS